jgi:hypothetical protein
LVTSYSAIMFTHMLTGLRRDDHDFEHMMDKKKDSWMFLWVCLSEVYGDQYEVIDVDYAIAVQVVG